MAFSRTFLRSFVSFPPPNSYFHTSLQPISNYLKQFSGLFGVCLVFFAFLILNSATISLR